jgi:hypothetical protein
MELGALAFVVLSIAMVPSTLRMWRGQPSRIERGLKLEYGRYGIKRARSMPMMLIGSVLFFGGGGLLGVLAPNLPKHTSHSHLTAGILTLLVVGIILIVLVLIGVICVTLSFTAKWWGWPVFVVPPHLRDPERGDHFGATNNPGR